MTTPQINRHRRWAVSLACAAALAAAGCSSDQTAQPASAPAAAAGAPSAAQAATGEVSIADTWVKSTKGTEDSSMTAAFGVLTNNTDKDLTIVSAKNSVSDRTELHEMAMDGGAMVMRPIAGGIAIPAKGSTTLEPGGLHVMIMDLKRPIEPGEQVNVDLTLSDGSTTSFTALAKEFAGANEAYNGGETTGMDMDMDMDGSNGTETASSDG